MNYAIIKSSSTDLLKVVDLDCWDYNEWEMLWIVRAEESRNIVFFNSSDEAEIFMRENFDEDMIEPQYKEIKDNTGKYYIG